MPCCEIHIINLQRSTERRDNISAQLDKLNIAYAVFNAVDGQQGHKLFDYYNEAKRQKLRGKTLTAGQLGCFASHYLLWQKCVTENKAFIILEDDARLFPELFLSFFNNTQQLGEKFECVRLFQNHSKNNQYKIVFHTENLSIAKFSKGHMRTTAYYLTPAAAAKFLANNTEWFLPVDISMDRFWANQVECYGTVPACLDNDPQFKSDIDYISGKKHYTLATRIRREWFAATESIRRALWNTRFAIRQAFFYSRNAMKWYKSK